MGREGGGVEALMAAKAADAAKKARKLVMCVMACDGSVGLFFTCAY